MEGIQKVKFSKRIKLSHRFNFLITASVVSIVIFAALFYKGQTNLRNIATKSLIQVIDSTEHVKVKNAVQLVGSSISKGIHDFNLSGDSVLYNFVKVYLEDLKYEDDKSGYFFVYRGTTCFFLSENKDLEGRDLVDAVDEKGLRFVEKEYNLVKEGGGFVTHFMKKPGAGAVEKISYVEPIKGTDLWIGSGVYTDNIKEVEASISNTIILNSVSINTSAFYIALFLMAVIIFISLNTKKFIAKPIKKITEITDNMALGKLELMEHDNHDEIKTISDSINNLVTNLRGTAVFAENIGSGNFDADYSKASEFDVIGKSLLDMRDSLKLAKEAEQARIEEEHKRNWIMNGHNLIADILRNNQHDLKTL
ncbi:MAG: cache domain-containing protein, partial [Bacteroidales bacterium]|nr:cache domain-containing protein [Bacteroidales bacterium]